MLVPLAREGKPRNTLRRDGLQIRQQGGKLSPSLFCWSLSSPKEEFLLRHKHGDWGELDPEDVRENERSLRHGYRVLSAYQTRTEERLWIITEHDRSATTILRPEEY